MFFVKFFDENDSIIFITIIVLITMPIWIPLVLLIQGVDDMKLWLSSNAKAIEIGIAVFVGIIMLISDILAFRWYLEPEGNQEPTDLVKKLVQFLIPNIGTIIATIDLFLILDLKSFAHYESGFFGLIELIIGLLIGIISLMVVIVVHIVSVMGTSGSSEKIKDRFPKKYFYMLIPLLEIIPFWLFEFL